MFVAKLFPGNYTIQYECFHLAVQILHNLSINVCVLCASVIVIVSVCVSVSLYVAVCVCERVCVCVWVMAWLLVEGGDWWNRDKWVYP